MTSIGVSELIKRAKATGHQTHTVAAAACFCGLEAWSLCVWCAAHFGNFEADRLPAGGECQHCSYSGPDCVVVHKLATEEAP